MTKLAFSLLVFYSLSVSAQEAVVDVKLHPAGSFKGRTTDVKGVATQKGDRVEAANIIVGLKSLATGISLRDEHTKKYLETEKFPEATLVSAVGQGGKGEGVIKIRGIEKKVQGTYKIEGSRLNAEFPIKFSDFQIKSIKYMGIGVDDEGIIHVNLPIKK